ncbi:hypothetical protein [Embleya scabrispora]|uniref:hypothetical protein n=1 Tax=Embleya scabrispora TaxID=159449 RepID=UPI00131A0DB1|nr:hypothetical protein [Embleya scabrispora]MYS82934.1 hypothetical protein [Streptomyces sp. SID5474]
MSPRTASARTISARIDLPGPPRPPPPEAFTLQAFSLQALAPLTVSVQVAPPPHDLPKRIFIKTPAIKSVTTRTAAIQVRPAQKVPLQTISPVAVLRALASGPTGPGAGTAYSIVTRHALATRVIRE